jgi:hypothetical protein
MTVQSERHSNMKGSRGQAWKVQHLDPHNAPLVALIDLKDLANTHVEQMCWEGRRLVARFKSLPAGEYAVGVEPLR